MHDARRASVVAWIAIAFVGCAVGVTDGDVSSSSRSDAGTDSGVESDASDVPNDSDGGTTGNDGSGGAGGAGGTGGGETGDTGGSGGAGGGSGGSGGGNDTCVPPSPTGQCDPFAQCGCTPGQNCIFTGATDGQTLCISAGSTAPQAACSTHDQCSVGHGCVGGVCKRFCQTSADCYATKGTCDQLYINDNGSQVPIAYAKACSAPCDPRTPQTVCGGSGVSCVPMDDGSTDCIGGFGTATGYGACSGNQWQNCAPGYICIDGSDCLRWCRQGFSGDCPGGQTCYGLNNPVVFNGVTYGVCDY